MRKETSKEKRGSKEGRKKNRQKNNCRILVDENFDILGI